MFLFLHVCVFFFDAFIILLSRGRVWEECDRRRGFHNRDRSTTIN